MLRVAQTPDHLQAALTQLKGAMDKRGLHYDDLSGRPKNLCALPPLFSYLFVKLTRCWRPREQSQLCPHAFTHHLCTSLHEPLSGPSPAPPLVHTCECVF